MVMVMVAEFRETLPDEMTCEQRHEKIRASSHTHSWGHNIWADEERMQRPSRGNMLGALEGVEEATVTGAICVERGGIGAGSDRTGLCRSL